ncbi:MAG: 30S ribosome-binding factor RbfA [Candidatus Krumholzibacteriota bacterium]|nr:30S ribosome-binding factor RbfA [Candidatus Krumholzibacteriota bacterium]
MSEKHRARIEETIHQLIAELLVRRVKDPRVANVSVTAVTVSRDYAVAKIKYNIIGSGDDPADVQRGLESSRGWIRGQIKGHLRLRTIPELVFSYDDSLDRAMRIEGLLQKIDGEDEADVDDDA